MHRTHAFVLRGAWARFVGVAVDDVYTVVVMCYRVTCSWGGSSRVRLAWRVYPHDVC